MSWLQMLRNRYRVTGDPLRTLRRIELFAVLLALLLCLQLALGALRLVTVAAPEAVTPAPDSLQVPAVLGPAVVAASERNEIITRPLFWSSRRPFEAVATLAEPDTQAGELKGIELVGLFGSGDQAGIIALVKGEKRRILLGDVVEGWTLKSISPSELVVTNGDRTETLALQRGQVKAAPADKSKRREQKQVGQVKAYPGSVASPSGKPAGAKDGAAAPAAQPEPERTLSLGPRGEG
jgi:hypothetical protein